MWPWKKCQEINYLTYVKFRKSFWQKSGIKSKNHLIFMKTLKVGITTKALNSLSLLADAMVIMIAALNIKNKKHSAKGSKGGFINVDKTSLRLQEGTGSLKEHTY